MIGEIVYAFRKSHKHRVLVDYVGLGFSEDTELVTWTPDKVRMCGRGEGAQPQRPCFLLEPESLGRDDNRRGKESDFPSYLTSKLRWRVLLECALVSRSEGETVGLIV